MQAQDLRHLGDGQQLWHLQVRPARESDGNMARDMPRAPDLDVLQLSSGYPVPQGLGGSSGGAQRVR
jgi:hypothetical protein